MDEVRSYLLSVCGASIVCALVNRFLEKRGGAAGAVKLLMGLFLALTVLQPISLVNPNVLENVTLNIDSEASQAVLQGEENSQRAVAEIIKSRTASYILQKAHALSVDVSVEILLSDDTVPVPVKVYITGTAAPYAKQQLQTIIEQDLGIAKENQIWI